MTHHTHEERTAGGIFGRVAGKAKEFVGGLRGRDDLTREGRLQQVQSEADREADDAKRGARVTEAAASVEQEQADADAARRIELAEAERREARRAEEVADALDPKEER
jgi:uncharacterized protein YjbJ (UPF0337 family)